MVYLRPKHTNLKQGSNNYTHLLYVVRSIEYYMQPCFLEVSQHTGGLDQQLIESNTDCVMSSRGSGFSLALATNPVCRLATM